MADVDFQVDISVSENGKRDTSYRIESDLGGKVSFQKLLNFFKSSLISISYDVLKEEQKNGFDKKPVVRVDGSLTKPVIDVKPFGTIEMTSRVQVNELLLEAYEGILKRSPVDTGEYIRSNAVVYNGREVASNMTQLSAWLQLNGSRVKPGDIFMLINKAPYARRLERLGVTAGRQQSRRVRSLDTKRKRSGEFILAANGVYFLTSKSILRKYKSNASIKFKFISGSLLGLSGVFKSPSSGNRKRSKRPSTYLYPAIEIKVGLGTL